MAKRTTKTERSIMEELLNELKQKTADKEGRGRRRITKAQALMRSMVDDALEGDQKMMANVLRYLEKLDQLQLHQREPNKAGYRYASKEEWEQLFVFFWRYRQHIELELERMQNENADAFAGEWSEVTLEHAPWYGSVHQDKILTIKR